MSKLMGFVVLVLSFGMVAAGVASQAYVVLVCPRQPDISSGHVIPVMIGSSNMAFNHVEYLTQFEKTIFGLSYAFVGIGLVGIFGYLFATKKLKKPTSFG